MGTAQAFQASMSSTPILVAAAILVVYIVLGMLYESYIHPITILSALPSAGVGALLALMFWPRANYSPPSVPFQDLLNFSANIPANYDLSLIALIGVILLIGIVKKNAIMMIDFALQAERLEGKSPREAIHQACLLRFRPIMMTTFAALFGAMPIALGGGAGSELRRPLGIAIVGGLLLSQWLTLYTTPVIYLYLERLARWLGRPYRPSRAFASNTAGGEAKRYRGTRQVRANPGRIGRRSRLWVSRPRRLPADQAALRASGSADGASDHPPAGGSYSQHRRQRRGQPGRGRNLARHRADRARAHARQAA